MSMRPCVGVLAKLLGREVRFAEDCIGERVEAAVAQLKDGEILLL
jgi:phosphoglycerate kinase